MAMPDKNGILISGGPGSGCSATGRLLGERLSLPVFDSDDFFHKPSDPPFQHQYSAEERRSHLTKALEGKRGWILSGSIATWEVRGLAPTLGVFLDVPKKVRLARLQRRQEEHFGERILKGGDMYEGHLSFLQWAGQYEAASGQGRNRATDERFLRSACPGFLLLEGELTLDEVTERIIDFAGQG